MGFERRSSPFQRDHVLSEDYIPDTVLGRDKELQEINEVLQQIIDNETPINAFIYGISGTGKTVSIKVKQQKLQNSAENYDDIYVTFLYQNCESVSSSYQATIAMANQLLTTETYDHLHTRLNIGYETLPSSGLPKESVYSIFFTLLDELTYQNTTYRDQLETALEDYPNVEIGANELIWLSYHSSGLAEEVPEYLEFPAGFDRLVDPDIALENTQFDRETVLRGVPEAPKAFLADLQKMYDIKPPSEVTNYVTVILDEVDRIGSRDEILYEIPRARANGRVANILPSVIGISNDIAYKESIRSKTDSSLRLKEITFKKYDADQLKKILTQRVDLAFKDGAYDDDVVPLAAAFARKQGGDARYAIDLLHKSGVKAKTNGDDIVGEKHIRQANEEKERDRVYEVTSDLDDQQQLVLAAIMYHDLIGETPIARNDLYPTYKQFSGDLLDKTNVPRRVADYLKEMAQLGLLDRRDAYEGPGKSGYKYTLDSVDYNMIIQILSDPSNSSGATLLPSDLIDEVGEITIDKEV
jgi:orc1/cdc6 family replication initiation protein